MEYVETRTQGDLPQDEPEASRPHVQEFAGRHNLREQDTIDQLAAISAGMDRKRLRYRTLIADNGLASGARGGCRSYDTTE